MIDFTSLFGSGNAAGGMRMPQMGQDMDLYGGQAPSMNLGMGSTNRFANADTGTGMMPSASFGQMPTNGMNMQNALGLLKTFGGMGGKDGRQQPEIQPLQIPMGSNQSYEQLLKMYGVRGLLG